MLHACAYWTVLPLCSRPTETQTHTPLYFAHHFCSLPLRTVLVSLMPLYKQVNICMCILQRNCLHTCRYCILFIVHNIYIPTLPVCLCYHCSHLSSCVNCRFALLMSEIISAIKVLFLLFHFACLFLVFLSRF